MKWQKLALFFLPSSWFSISLLAQGNADRVIPENHILWLGIRSGAYQEDFLLTDSAYSSTLSTRLLPTAGIIIKYKWLPGLTISFPIGSDSILRTKGIYVLLPIVIKRKVVLQYQGALLQELLYKTQQDTLPLRSSYFFSTNLNAYWLFNANRYSYSFAYGFGERQIDDGFSWCLGLTFRFIHLQNPDYSKVKSDVDENFYHSVNMVGVGIIGGFSGTLVLDFLSKPPQSLTFGNLEVLLGPTLVFTEIGKDSVPVSRGIKNLFQAKMSLGHMSRKWLYRILVTGNTQVLYDRHSLRFLHRYTQSHLQVVRFF